MTDTVMLRAAKAKGGRITVTAGDGIAGYFLGSGQHPFCKGKCPTICECRVPWVVVRV